MGSSSCNGKGQFLEIWSGGPCNRFNCLGHFKNVCDDNNDDDERIGRICHRPCKTAKPIELPFWMVNGVFFGRVAAQFSAKQASTITRFLVNIVRNTC